MIDIQKIRRETPNCENVIHLDNCGSSLPPQAVVDRMKEYLEYEGQVGGYNAADNRKDQISQFYAESARLLNCNPENIAFCTSATDAFTKAISSIAFQECDYILTTDDDYISNQLAFLSLGKRYGVKIERIRNLDNGDLDLDHCESLIKTLKPRLVSITHVPTSSGLIQDVESIGQLCKKYGARYIVDACQSAGQLPLDVGRIGCDFLSATGRKFLRGPRGTGFLYASDEVLDAGLVPLFADQEGWSWKPEDQTQLHTTAVRFENWEKPYASIEGFAVALRYANEIGLTDIRDRNSILASRLRTEVGAIDGFECMDLGTTLASIVTFKSRKSQEEITGIFKEANINFTFATNQSAVIDFDKKGVEWVIRLSPHYYNTEEEIESVVNALS